MNDIERLIAGLPRPLPSADLDARIAGLAGPTRRAGRAAHDGTRFAMRRLIVSVASTAVAGLLGFLIGRHSAAPAVAGQPAVQSTATASTMTDQTATVSADSPAVPAPSPFPAQDRTIVRVQVPESEALARFVMPSKRTVGLFGEGPLEDRSETSHLE